jgi:hypothetical protein
MEHGLKSYFCVKTKNYFCFIIKIPGKLPLPGSASPPIPGNPCKRALSGGLKIYEHNKVG